MAAGDNLSPSAHQELNRLYWESDRSVNQIAEDLGISKGTLYEELEERPVGEACPECGTELVHANRTARDRKVVSCPGCGLEADQQKVVEDRSRRGDRLGIVADDQALRRVLAGTALLGLATGVLLARLLRKG